MVSHASSRDISEPTFCPWKTMIPEQNINDTSTSPTQEEQQDTNTDSQHFSANNGLDLLSNIAFLSGIIDSPTQFSSLSSREHGSEEHVKPQICVASDQDQGISQESVHTTDIISKTNESDKDKMNNSKAKSYIINTTQTFFNPGVSSTSAVAPAITASQFHTQAPKVNRPYEQSSSPASCATNPTVTIASNHQNVNPLVCTNQNNRPPVNKELHNNTQLSYPLMNKFACSGPHANMFHNGTDAQRNPYSLFSNLSNIGQNVFPLGNMHHFMPPQRQPIPTELKGEHKENINHHQVLPWMFPPYRPAPPTSNTAKHNHTPVSVQNWLADAHNATQHSEISHKASQQSSPMPLLVNTAQTTTSSSSGSTPMAMPHSTPTTIFTRTGPSTNNPQVSSVSTPMVISHSTGSSVFNGKDETTTLRSSVSGQRAFPECFASNVFPVSASFYQQPPPRTSPAIGSPASDLDSPDSAFCSPASGDGSIVSLDISDMIHNVSDRSTPSSGIQSESSSVENVSPGSSSNHSNQSCSDSSSSPQFERPSSSASGSPPPTSFAQNQRPLFENSSSGSIPAVSQQQSLHQGPAIHTTGISSASAPQSSSAASVAVSSGQRFISPDGADMTKKKSRTNYTPAQVRSLERVFLENPYPESLVMEQLSKNLNIPEQKLKVWFQNKRARWRRRVHENKVPPVHPVFMTPQSTYGMMRPPLAPGPFFPFSGNLNSGPPRHTSPGLPPGLQRPCQMNPYILQQF